VRAGTFWARDSLAAAVEKRDGTAKIERKQAGFQVYRLMQKRHEAERE
jgi:hypothetical protein